MKLSPRGRDGCPFCSGHSRRWALVLTSANGACLTYQEPVEPSKPAQLCATTSLGSLFSRRTRGRYARYSSSSSIGRNPSELIKAVAEAQQVKAPMSLDEQTAFELFSSSFSATSSDARFIV